MTEPDTSTTEPASPDESRESPTPEDGPSVDSDRPSSGLDPATLADDPTVAFRERVYRHEDADHCEADAKGRVVLGLKRDDGAVLLAVNDENGHALLPNATVAPDQTFRAAGRGELEDVLDAPVTIGDPVAVRRVEHYTTDDPEPGGNAASDDAADAEPHNVTHHVVFEASLATAVEAGSPADGADAEGDGDAPEPTVEKADWTVGWYHDIPAAVADEEGDAVADIRRFLE